MIVNDKVYYSLHDSVLIASNNVVWCSVWSLVGDSVESVVDDSVWNEVLNSVDYSVQNIARNHPKNQKVLRGVYESL